MGRSGRRVDNPSEAARKVWSKIACEIVDQLKVDVCQRGLEYRKESMYSSGSLV